MLGPRRFANGDALVALWADGRFSGNQLLQHLAAGNDRSTHPRWIVSIRMLFTYRADAQKLKSCMDQTSKTINPYFRLLIPPLTNCEANHMHCA
jgi:hypothetical protein